MQRLDPVSWTDYLSPLTDRFDSLVGGQTTTPWLFASDLIDRTILATFTGLARIASTRLDVDLRLQLEATHTLEVYGEMGWLDDPASYHRTPPELGAPSLVPENVFLGYLQFEHMRFESGYEPREGEPGRERWLNYEANKTSHAWVLRHRTEDRPWIVCVHGYRMGQPIADLGAFDAERIHKELGVNVLSYVMPLHGPRREDAPLGDLMFAPGPANLVHTAAQAVWDVRRILGWIRSQSSRGIGLYGISLGGFTASLLSSLCDDVTCVIAGIPASDFVGLLDRHSKTFVDDRPDVRIFWEKAQRAAAVVSPLAVPSRVPRQHRHIFAGVTDRLVSAESVVDLWRHWEEPEIHWYQGGHLGFRFEPAVHDFVARALRRAGLVHAPGAGSAPFV